MAKTTNPRKPTKETHRTSSGNNGGRKSSKNVNQAVSKTSDAKQPPSWAVMRSILTCKHLQVSQNPKSLNQKQEDENGKSKKMKCSGSSLCDNTKVMQRPAAAEQQLNSPDLFYRRKVSPSSAVLNSQNAPAHKGGAAGGGGAFRGMPFRRLSGCYECRMVVDPVLGFTRDPALRSAIRACPQCGEVFMKPEYLDLHQTVRHAVSELGPEDTSKNIVEIIFQSSWLKKQVPVCKIDRILKVHNTNRTVSRFEGYRDSIKARATGLQKKHPRCIADGNELLRFHCTTLTCSLGVDGSSNLCNSIPQCSVCSIIRDGFKIRGPGPEVNGPNPMVNGPGRGILTTAQSGRAHDRAEVLGCGDERRAMLVCRVIAGRVRKVAAEGDFAGVSGGRGLEEYDSVAGVGGVYSSLDELYVYNPKAILPCFVVIYSGF